MRKYMLMLLATAVLSLASGCGTTKPVDVDQMAKIFYGQQRDYATVRVTGLDELSMKGSNMTIELRAPHNPLSIIPKDPSVAMTMFSVAKDIVLGGMGIFYAADVMNNLAARPQVVSQQVVQPDVIAIGEGGATKL
jgi:hypothetical protein